MTSLVSRIADEVASVGRGARESGGDVPRPNREYMNSAAVKARINSWTDDQVALRTSSSRPGEGWPKAVAITVVQPTCPSAGQLS
jgi:hypothetical protein